MGVEIVSNEKKPCANCRRAIIAALAVFLAVAASAIWLLAMRAK